jgi:hypothetical protein
MLKIELTDEERETLRHILNVDLGALEIEIQRTDHREFKELLKHRRDVLKGMLFKVPGMAVA